MLEWGEECEKLSRISLGERSDVEDRIAIRIQLKQRGRGKLPDFFYTNTHPIVSDRFKHVLESIGAPNIEFIPTQLVGARVEARSGLEEDISIEDSGIDIDRDFYVLNISQTSDALDRQRTTMSNEFISRENDAVPGVYLTAVFQTDRPPPLFVLPGCPFALLASEEIVTLTRKGKIKGLKFEEVMDTSHPNKLDLYPTSTENTVSMAEAWRQYRAIHITST